MAKFDDLNDTFNIEEEAPIVEVDASSEIVEEPKKEKRRRDRSALDPGRRGLHRHACARTARCCNRSAVYCRHASREL